MTRFLPYLLIKKLVVLLNSSTIIWQHVLSDTLDHILLYQHVLNDDT